MRALRALANGLRGGKKQPRKSSTSVKATAPISTASSVASTTAHGVAEWEDTTMKNAIEFLTQDDGESALVFALVHDPEFRLATAIACYPAGVDVNVIRALLFVFDMYEDQLRKLIGMLMFQEMIDTLNWNELFRANSSTTAIIREYTCELGMDFLQHAFRDILVELWDTIDSYEVNPLYLQPTDDIVANRQRLETLADKVLERIFSSAHLFPYQVAKIYRVLEVEMVRLLERERRSNASFPRLSAISEDSSEDRRSNISLPRLSSLTFDNVSDDFLTGRGSGGNSAAREEFFMHLGGLVFLRFICPAMVLPHKLHLTPNGAPPSKNLQRTLVLLAKLFQSLANNTEYGSREHYMLPFNGFLERNRSKLNNFYEQICQQSQNDVRRESAILRSNTAPRISQIFATGRESVVNLTGALSIEDPENSLPVLRKWIRDNTEYIAQQVSGGSKFRRRGGKTIVISPTVQKKQQLKRKLKSAKGNTSIPLEMKAVGEDDMGEDEEREEEKKKKQEEDERHLVRDSMAMSFVELDHIIGQTSHRDIQLMKIYYSKLAQNGLQGLLDVNSAENEGNWVPHKSKDDVVVYRKNSSRQSNGFGSDKSRFVEMKGHVIIHAPPRQVFKYLRSQESLRDLDSGHINVRHVEPVDESKVVVHHSHENLSLWPTWLVKPRDSCDLHSFVENTGRPNTYAVLMESIPRPDVPEIKGVVRMSYATGGYLIEPMIDNEDEDEDMTMRASNFTSRPGEYTKLTGIVRADFKGALPRVIAESICYRQVLNVHTIRTRVEAARHIGNSTWG